MKQYLDLCRHVLEHGVDKDDRTGTGTISTFGYQMRYDLSQGFPLLTTKKVFLKGILYELLWFIHGETNIKYLTDHNVHIWDEWANEKGDLGRVYGAQWRDYRGVLDKNGVETIVHRDQLFEVIEQIKKNPASRRHLVIAFNPVEQSEMALPPCHAFFQFYVANNKLSCQLYQRSVDTFLGLPFNIASYSLLTHMIAQVTGLGVGEFIHTSGDLHIYKNHIPQIELQLTRSPRLLPTLKINPEVKHILDFQYKDFSLEGYDPYPTIKGDISV